MSGTSQADIQHALTLVDSAVDERQLSSSGAENLRAWLTKSAYRDYQPRLFDMVRAGKFAELDTLFWEIIPFGTGGRRGRMADLGSATMNPRTIAESAHGMAVYLKKVKGTAGGRAVVAHDTRNRSVEFARITATTLAAHGLTVFLFDSHRSTPELSFAVRHLKCDIGAMISASHNPPADNGFKAYWSDGAQVLPPHDRGIIECVAGAEEIPAVQFDQGVADGLIQIIGEAVDRAYVASVLKLSLSNARDVRAVYTPLHGVGETSVYQVLRQAGFSQVEILESQRSADGSFPNVPRHLPNPELTSAFEPAIQQAQKSVAELVLASDPDADRLGVAVRAGDGSYAHLSGNQVGALLLDYVLRKRSAAGTLSQEHFVCTTLVTTPMVRAVSEPYGVRVIDDLQVGFKYIGQTIESLGPEKFVFGLEESLGYLAGSYCRDKDAAIPALYIMELAAELKAQDRSLLEDLDRLYCNVGYFQESQRSHSSEGARGKEEIGSLMGNLRKKPPQELAGIRMAQARDYRDQVIRRIPDGHALGELKTTKGDLLFLDSVPGAMQISIAVRPSGTEPKIKFYFFARAHCPDGAALQAVKAHTARAMNQVQDGLMDWVQEVLKAEAGKA